MWLTFGASKMTGTVIKSTGSRYLVRCGDRVLDCVLKGRLRLDLRKTTNPVAVGDRVDVEEGVFDPATARELERMGYTLHPRSPWGFMNVVTWDRKTNQLDAASDPRRPSGLGQVQ